MCSSDLMSSLSETTNLAPAMAGTDVFTHIKFMMKPTIITYLICIVLYLILGFKYSDAGSGQIDSINTLIDGISNAYTVNPVLFIPPIIVILAIALKVPAMPRITLGVISAGILMPFFQDTSISELLEAAYSGAISKVADRKASCRERV